MEFDFQREYSRYTNVELLRVILLKHQYQPAAVAMAEDLLSARVVTDEDHRLAGESVRPKGREKTVPAATAEWKPGDDIFASVAPAVTFESIRRRWLIILIALGITAAYNLYHQALVLTTPHVLRYIFSGWSGYFGFSIITLELCSLIFFYLKQKRGWILTTVYVCYMLLSNIVALLPTLIFHSYQNIGSIFIKIALFSGLALLVWSPEVRSFYDIDRTLMRRTTIISAAACMLYYAAIFSWYYLGRP